MIYTKVETRHLYLETETSDPRDMYGKYLAKPIVKTWKEQFIDQDTKEQVEVERRELLMESGTFIGKDVLAKIQFFMQADGIESVTVSNQRREGSLRPNSALRSYVVQMVWGETPRKILLRAQDINQAIEIANDFSELHSTQPFGFTAVKEVQGFIITENLMRIDTNPIIHRYAKSGDGEAYRAMMHKLCSDIIPVNLDIDEEKEECIDRNRSWFQIQVEYGTYREDELEDASTATVINIKDIKKDTNITNSIVVNDQQFLVYADSAERAMAIVNRLISTLTEARKLQDKDTASRLYIALQKAAPFPVSHYVPYEFTLAYAKDGKIYM